MCKIENRSYILGYRRDLSEHVCTFLVSYIQVPRWVPGTPLLTPKGTCAQLFVCSGKTYGLGCCAREEFNLPGSFSACNKMFCQSCWKDERKENHCNAPHIFGVQYFF